MSEPGNISLAVAMPRGDKVRVALTVDGHSVLYQLKRRVAASLIAELARALSDAPADPGGS